ncbi:MAG: SDR family NAD(P)-dependent oxidoreductase [Mycobacterium sp.]
MRLRSKAMKSAGRRSLRGQRVLLTGASSGIGRALAVELAARGAVLVVAARRTDLLETLADEIAAAGHPRPTVAFADLSDAGAAVPLAAVALNALGGSIDLLINNAGTSLTGAQSMIGDASDARAVFQVNVWSPLALTAALVPVMRAAGTGTIVNVTSTIQAVPLPLLGYYAASKAALAQATRSLRHELRDTAIRVVEVVPGATDTALRDIDELPWKKTPPKTLPPVQPQRIAAAVTRGLQQNATRIVCPRYSLVPLEIPALGRLVATLGGKRVDTLGALARTA